MTSLATHVSVFLRERLPLERGASERTCDTYALGLRLFLEFAAYSFRGGRQRLPGKRRATGKAESLGRRGLTSHNTPDRRLDRKEFGIVYEGRSGLIALLHHLGLEYHKPRVIPRKLDNEKQKAFIESYEKLLNSLADNEAVLFADAVHPTHAARPPVAGRPDRRNSRSSRQRASTHQHSRRDRPGDRPNPDDRGPDHRRRLDNQFAAIDRGVLSDAGAHPCFSGQCALSSRQARAGMVTLPGRRIKLHYIPTYCPHLNPIERLWGVMHKHVTHNKCYATCAQFADATLGFLRETFPRNWAELCEFGHRQFPHHQPQGFSGCDVNGVYNKSPPQGARPVPHGRPVGHR